MPQVAPAWIFTTRPLLSGAFANKNPPDLEPRFNRLTMEPKPVILDTDIGSDIDDTWALAALLHSPELQPLLITTTSGDTVYRATITARLLEIAGRTDIPLGIGLSHGVMEDRHRHQGPWVSDYDLSNYQGMLQQDGIAALINTVRNAAQPVTLISIAPSFNIARALELAPDIAGKCHFVGMHGSFDRGYGPDSPPEPETNVRMDVSGFRAVLAADWLSFRITPLDTCGQIVLDGNQFKRIRESTNPLVRACMENYRIWAKRVDWMTVDYEEERTSVLFDNVAIFMAYDDQYIEWDSFPVEVDEDGLTRRAETGNPVQVAIRWKDLGAFKEHITRRILNET